MATKVWSRVRNLPKAIQLISFRIAETYLCLNAADAEVSTESYSAFRRKQINSTKIGGVGLRLSPNLPSSRLDR